jgi:hypothetical protein
MESQETSIGGVDADLGWAKANDSTIALVSGGYHSYLVTRTSESAPKHPERQERTS